MEIPTYPHDDVSEQDYKDRVRDLEKDVNALKSERDRLQKRVNDLETELRAAHWVAQPINYGEG